MGTRDLRRFGYLSVATALGTLALKLVAWLITGSVGLLSDALESTVNLVAATLMLAALHVSARPPDQSHQYGHEKAELFSAGAEGLMIVAAAVAIAVTAIPRLLHPEPLERVGAGLAVNVLAAAVNLTVALVLVRAGRRHRSLALEADGRHLVTDVWTSAGVVVGVALVVITGWERLDPVIALLVGANIVVTGTRLLWRAMSDLMDPPFPPAELAAVRAVLDRHAGPDLAFHGLRTRTAGHRRFMSVHLLVPGNWTVLAGHDLAERVEGDLRAAVAHLTVLTHVEPRESPASYLDEGLDRLER